MSLRIKWFYFSMFNLVAGVYLISHATSASARYQPVSPEGDVSFVLMNTLERTAGSVALIVGGICLLGVVGSSFQARRRSVREALRRREAERRVRRTENPLARFERSFEAETPWVDDAPIA